MVYYDYLIRMEKKNTPNKVSNQYKQIHTTHCNIYLQKMKLVTHA